VELDGIRGWLSEREIHERIRNFMETKEVFISRITPELEKRINVRQFVENLELIGKENLKLTLRFDQEGSIKPTEVIQKLFDLSDSQTRLLRILKTSVSFTGLRS